MAERIVARGVGKMYRLGEQATGYNVLRERLAGLMRRGLRPEPKGLEFWALRNVDFTVGAAEVVGLIGKNGAGKSTLLKILSRITEPTEGRIDLYGRVASLLEVGIGFHPELSGRENIFLNGAILGMSRGEIRRKFDEIVEFAGVSRFLETPVKRYSSGMYVRLAFAVAAHLEPDILVVDEVLAVGDAEFQQKCLGKMRSIRSEGRSVIVVSHNMGTITSLCERAVWLREGEVQLAGAAADVVRRYLSEGTQNDLVWVPRHPAHEAFVYHQISIVEGGSGAAPEAFRGDAPIDVLFDFEILKPHPPGRLELQIRNELAETVFTSTSADAGGQRNHAWALGRHRWRCRIPANFIAPGRYFVTVNEPYGTHDYHRENIMSFTVSEQNSLASIDGRAGKVAPLLEWTEL